MTTSSEWATVPEQERESWAFWLGCPGFVFDQKGLHLHPNAALEEQSSLIVLSTAINTIVSIPAGDFDYFERKLRPLAGGHFIALTSIINALGEDTVRLGNILWQSALETGRFQPRADPRVRRLARDEMRFLNVLEQACHPAEWEHSCLRYDSENTYGFFENGTVVAAAHFILLRPDLASIGVLTHPSYRHRGYSTMTAGAAIARALAEGHSVHYQTLLENRPSIALARKLGFGFYGMSMRVQVRSMRENR